MTVDWVAEVIEIVVAKTRRRVALLAMVSLSLNRSRFIRDMRESAT